MEKTLITGASGFLGGIIYASLKEEGFTISSLGRNKSNHYCTDLSHEVPFLNNSFDIIIHAAGKAHSVPKTTLEEKEFYDVNYQGTINLCKAINKLKVKPKAFIFISTISAYGLDTGSGITEESPLLGSTPYAKSKIRAEEYLQTWAKENDITLGIFRLPLIAGPNPPGNLGAMINGIKTGRYLSIGNASARKSIVWAEDIADLIPKVSEIGGVYNLTDTYHPTFGELEKEISKCLGKKDPVKIPLWLANLLGRVGDLLGSKAPINSEKINKITSSLTFDDSKARKRLDWKPKKVLDKIAEIV
jgi:nucleoside-diphosphate-sugar epimerase